MPRGRQVQNLKIRFESKFEKLSEKECWNWKGFIDKDGYGTFWYLTNSAKAHRISYFIYKSIEVPKGLLVCHHCDNPSCVNPNHLFIGSFTDNNRDMFNKGRDKVDKGEQKWSATLKNEDIPNIRKLIAQGIKDLEIARQFKTSKTVIGYIRRGTTWKAF